MYGIMPGVVTISSKFDLFFVNTLGLSSNSGMIIHVLLLSALLILAIKYSLSSAERVKTASISNSGSFLYRNLGGFRFFFFQYLHVDFS